MDVAKARKEEITYSMIEILYKAFEIKTANLETENNNPFKQAFLSNMDYNDENDIRNKSIFFSIIKWLNDSIAMQKFFEKTAHILSDGEKREYTSQKLGNLNLSTVQKNNINEIITNLSIGKNTPNMQRENTVLYKLDNSELTSALDFSADVFIEDENEITAIELKSVRPNSGEMRGEKHKILEGKCALYNKNPDKKVNFFLGFPFDPISGFPTKYDKERFMDSIINLRKYFDKNEILLASELWDFLSGTKNTMEFLLKIINKISTPEFIDRYRFVNDVSNIGTSKYLDYLREWNLYSQLLLTGKDEIIRKAIRGDKRLIKIYNQQMFKDGEYNYNRFEKLSRLI